MNTSIKLNTNPIESELQKYYEKDEWNKAAMRHLTVKLCEWHAKASTISRLCSELSREISDEALDYTAIGKED